MTGSKFIHFILFGNIFRNIEILHETSLQKSSISIEDAHQIDESLQPQYVGNNIQHLEISPNIPETITPDDEA